MKKFKHNDSVLCFDRTTSVRDEWKISIKACQTAATDGYRKCPDTAEMRTQFRIQSVKGSATVPSSAYIELTSKFWAFDSVQLYHQYKN